MKKYLLFLLAAILPALRIGAQQPPGVACQEWQVVAGDTIPHVRIRPVWVFARGADLRRYRKLVAAVKKVYPVAKIARARMTEMEAELQRLPTKKAQKAYIRGVYRQIKEEYTPVVKHMTRTQGKVLLKLIDRETDYTAYEVLREFRGGFVAGFWQTLSRVSGRTSNRSTTPKGTTACSNRSSATTKRDCSDLPSVPFHGRRDEPYSEKYRLFSDRSEYSRIFSVNL